MDGKGGEWSAASGLRALTQHHVPPAFRMWRKGPPSPLPQEKSPGGQRQAAPGPDPAPAAWRGTRLCKRLGMILLAAVAAWASPSCPKVKGSQPARDTMPLLSPKSPGDPASRRAAAKLDELLALSEAARDRRAFDEAIDYLQAAQELAPLNGRIRQQLGDTLLEAAEARAGQKRKPSASSRVIGFDTDPDEDSPRAPRRRKSAKSRPRRPDAWEDEAGETPPARPHDEDGFAALDHAESNKRRRRARGTAAGQPKARDGKNTKPRRRSTTRPRRAMAMAALYAGILLVAVGLSHGMIARLMSPVALPSPAVEERIPDLLRGMLDDASTMLADGKSDAAIELLERARMQYPEHEVAIGTALAQAHRIAGGQMMGRREYANAVEQFEAAVNIDGGEPRNWVELGRAYREFGRSIQSRDPDRGRQLLRKAQAAYQEALEVDAEHAGALLGLAQAHAFLQERTQAVSFYERVVKTAPDSPEARLARQHLAQLRG